MHLAQAVHIQHPFRLMRAEAWLIMQWELVLTITWKVYTLFSTVSRCDEILALDLINDML